MSAGATELISAVDGLDDGSLVGTLTLARMSLRRFAMVGALSVGDFLVECGAGDEAWGDSAAGR